MDLYREDTAIVGDRQYRVRYLYDNDHEAPWDDGEGRGIVTDWVSADRSNKKPGWRVLHVDRSSVRYFDWAGTIAKAKAEGWGLGEKELAELTAKLGRAPTKGEIAEGAAQQEFDFFRAYCRDEWYYVGIEVTAIIDGEPDEDLQDTCWGFETWKDYHEEAAAEMAAELDERVVKELAERAEIEVREVAIREKARGGGFSLEIYDDALVDEVEDGYWVTAKLFVPKEDQ